MGRKPEGLSKRKSPRKKERERYLPRKPTKGLSKYGVEPVATRSKRALSRTTIFEQIGEKRNTWKFSAALSKRMLRHSYDAGITVQQWVECLHSYAPASAFAPRRPGNSFLNSHDSEGGDGDSEGEDSFEWEDDDDSYFTSECELEAEASFARAVWDVDLGEVLEEGVSLVSPDFSFDDDSIQTLEEGEISSPLPNEEEDDYNNDEEGSPDYFYNEEQGILEEEDRPPDNEEEVSLPLENGEEPLTFLKRPAEGRKAKNAPPKYALLFVERLYDFILFLKKPCPNCSGECEFSKQIRFVGLSLIVLMRCKGCRGVHKFSLFTDSPLKSRLWCLSIVAGGLTFAHLNSFCSLFGLHNISETQFYEIQTTYIIPATKMTIEQKRLRWVDANRNKTFNVLTDARHAAVVNSDGNTTTLMLCNSTDQSERPPNEVFTFDTVRSETAGGMAVQTDAIGLTKAFQWLLDKNLKIAAVSFDDCSDNITTLTPLRNKHQEQFGLLFEFYKDSWHKGKKLKAKCDKVFSQVWTSYAKDPVQASERFQSLLREVFPQERAFPVSDELCAVLTLIVKLKAKLKEEKGKEKETNSLQEGEGVNVSIEEVFVTITKEVVLSSPKKYQVEVLQKILKYLDLVSSVGKKNDLIERIFAIRETVVIPLRMLELKKKAQKQSQTGGEDNTELLKTAEKKLTTILDAEKRAVSLEIFDKSPRLSSHFHACATRCNGGTPKVLRGYLLNCLLHWGGIHTGCESQQCKSNVYSSKVPLKHVISFVTLYLVYTSGKPGTNMSLESLQYYTKDLATSICESFHSYLAFWAPKGIHFSSTYETRIFMAEMSWNENHDRGRKWLPRRKEPDKGKRARGGIRSRWITPMRSLWVNEILKNIELIAQ
jgi:hypothetical protein